MAVELSRTTSRFTDMLDHVLTPLQGYLDDPEVTDVEVNPDGRLLGQALQSVGGNPRR